MLKKRIPFIVTVVLAATLAITGLQQLYCYAEGETDPPQTDPIQTEEPQKIYTENASANALSVLKEIENNSTIDGIEIETVEVSKDDIELMGFSQAVQDALGDFSAGKERVDKGVVLRVVIPNGSYSLSTENPNPLYLYSNTILDCRGTGADNDAGLYTPYDAHDDYSSVDIYTNSNNGCVIRCGRKGEGSAGWDFYKNITILGGTIHGYTENGAGIVGSNIRFGHASNIKVIGVKVQDNHGAHHLEVGAVDKVLVSDSIFTGHSNGDTSEGKKEYSIEAVQLDVTHRETLNFSSYDTYDDLATKNVTIINNTFSNVFRGVGSHHAVLGSYYQNIKIINNTFKDLDDRAINAMYFKGGEISNNTITDVVSGINVTSMAAPQIYQPNKDSKIDPRTSVESLNSNLKVQNNKITLSGSKIMENYFSENLIKYGIRVSGDNVTSSAAKSSADYDRSHNQNASASALPAGNYYLTGVTVSSNTIGVDSSSATTNSRIKTGILLWYLKNCTGISSNNINLGSKNADDNTAAGIKVNHSTGNTLNKNIITGVSYGSKALGIQVSDGSTNTKITNNTIKKAAKDAVSFTNINSGTNNITGNIISDPKKNGITVYKSKANLIGSNTVNNSGNKGIYVEGTAANIKSNKVNNSKNGQGICVMGTATNVSNNVINKATMQGIYLTKGKVSTLFQKNTVKNCKKHAIYTTNGVKYAIGNKFSGNKSNTVGLSKGICFKYKTTTVKVKKSKKLAVFKSSGSATWTSSNKKVATVNKKGKVTAKKKGKTTITAKKNGIKTTCIVTVK